jgi:hypothetical protein
MSFKEGVCLMHRSPVFCEQCAEAGKNRPADYVYQSEETSLAGPMLGDPDAWPPDVSGRRLLCREHYEQLPADSWLDYVPAEDHLGHLGEMGRT